MMNDEKPFVCPVADCSMRFTNEDHLNVHSKKHEMSLALNAGGPSSSSSPAHHFVDQTPTPTKFLRNYEEISLFQELPKNPFDDAYKKALDSDGPPIPGPHSGELNTPTLILTDTMKSSTSAVTSSLGGGERVKGTEPIKPSPLAKSSNSSTIVLDLSGKTVISGAQPSSTTPELVKRNLTTTLADSTSVGSPDLDLGAHSQSDLLVTTVSSTSESANSVSLSHMALHSLTDLPSTQSHSRLAEAASQFKPDSISVKQEVAELTDGILTVQEQQQHQQCTMQVLLQLPSGETIPISIPATINNLNKIQYMGGQSDVKPQLQQNTIQPQHILSAPAKGVPVSTSAASQATQAVKQRLKAQLQNQHYPSKTIEPSLVAASANSAFIPATATTPGHNSGAPVLLSNSPPALMADSPGSEVNNLSDSSDYSIESKRQKMSPETGDSEERRRRFLERNRAAAARCRQKRKHWISNLERKADELSNTNARLQTEVKLLRGEVAQLKTLLLAHKDCPVTQQQKSQGQLQHVVLSDSNLASQELAQVVPTGEATTTTVAAAATEPIQLSQTFVTFVREPVQEVNRIQPGPPPSQQQ